VTSEAALDSFAVMTTPSYYDKKIKFNTYLIGYSHIKAIHMRRE